MESLLRPPIGFAHRGARAHAPENTIEAFQLALRLGATGIESDVWLTADGVPVLDHDGVAVGRLRKRPIASVDRADLARSVPTLSELFDTCGTDYHLSLDVKDPAAAEAIVVRARDAGADLSRLWLCHHHWEQVAAWRALDDRVRLVDSTRLRRMKEGPERRAATLAEAGIDAVNLHATDWTGGLTTLFHRFGVHTFGWDAQHERVLAGLLHMGIDAVYSDHVDRMMEALQQSQR
jgi:glycerophosphoryl diester phosphodiesterase